jgi:hypothetical protein
MGLPPVTTAIILTLVILIKMDVAEKYLKLRPHLYRNMFANMTLEHVTVSVDGFLYSSEWIATNKTP